MATFLSFLPPWLSGLLTEKFYNACIIHEGLKRNGKNYFCISCCEAICHFCKPTHETHNIIQIRTHIYCDVVRVDDLQKLMDCSTIQPYMVNGAKAVNLKPRSNSSGRSSDPACACNRIRRIWIQYEHCSIFCKIKEIIETGEKLSECVYNCEDVHPPETPSSVLVPMGSMNTESRSNSGVAIGGMSCMSLACTATTDSAVLVRKKRTNVVRSRPAFRPVTGGSGRRKGTPRRSHLA